MAVSKIFVLDIHWISNGYPDNYPDNPLSGPFTSLGISDARVGGRRGIPDVFEPDTGDVAVGPDCDR